MAAPIAKNVLQSSIDALGIEKQSNEIEKEFNYIDRVYAKVPNVIGMTKEEATKSLSSFKVEYSGSGSKVAYQSPVAGTQIYEGETVKLMLDD